MLTPIKNVHLGGISQSRYYGAENSVGFISGLDMYSSAGSLRLNSRLIAESAADYGNSAWGILACVNGFRFVNNLMVWGNGSNSSLNLSTTLSTSIYTASNTRSDTTSLPGIFNAIRSNNKIYFTTQRTICELYETNGSPYYTVKEIGWLDIDSEDGGTGATAYALPVAVSEAATARQSFVVPATSLDGFAVKIAAAGAGTVAATLTLHDSSNNLISTMSSNSFSNTWNGKWLVFNTANANERATIFGRRGQTLHFHITVSNGTTIETNVNNDMEGCAVRYLTYMPQLDASNAYFCPMYELNGVLYIGYGRYVHQIESDVFSSKVLTVQPNYAIRDFSSIGTDLLVGTSDWVDGTNSAIYRWNTFSVTYSYMTVVTEPSVNAFIEYGDAVLFSAGYEGRFYRYYDGQPQYIYKMPGYHDPKVHFTVLPNSVAKYKGRTLFGYSVSGAISGYDPTSATDPVITAVYSVGSYQSGYPMIFGLEYLPSTSIYRSSITCIEFRSAITQTNKDLIVGVLEATTVGTWNTTATANYVAKSAYTSDIYVHNGYVESRVIYYDNPTNLTDFLRFYVKYISLPANTSVVIKYRTEYSTTWNTLTTVVDAIRKIIVGELNIRATVVELRVELNTTDGVSTPIIEGLYVESRGEKL